MDKRSYSITKLLQSASPAPRHLSHRFNCLFPRIALWLVVVLLLAACGPGQPKVDSTALAATTARIAQDYAANSNLDQARVAIDALEVANPHQYLLLQAEEAVNANQDPQTTSALVKLAVALRLSSGSIQAYAVQNGIVSVPPTEPPVPTLDFEPSSPAPVVVQANAAPAVVAASLPLRFRCRYRHGAVECNCTAYRRCLSRRYTCACYCSSRYGKRAERVVRCFGQCPQRPGRGIPGGRQPGSR